MRQFERWSHLPLQALLSVWPSSAALFGVAIMRTQINVSTVGEMVQV
jgi:hypothetical protein